MPNPTWAQFRQEPYRLLFPLGIAFAAIGLGVWIPYYFLPGSFPYPGQAHAAIQIQGFLLCFVFGFLCTMLPKVLGVEPLGTAQFALFPAALSGIAIAALAGAPLVAQACHLALLLNFLVFILLRWPTRRGNPPSPFAFIALGMTSDLLGTAFRIFGLSGHGGSFPLRAGGALQYQAFPLLLILGVGSFLLPKLFGNQIVDPETLRSQPKKSAFAFLPWGALFLLATLAEAWAPNSVVVRSGAAIRATIWFWFLLCPLRLHRVPKGLPGYLAGARFSLWAIGAGLVMPVFLPAYRVAWEHVVFITGYLWLTISVATRVVTAHGGRLEWLTRRRKRTLAVGWLLILAMAARVSTDLWTGGHWLHMAVAAGFGFLALGIWAAMYLPMVRFFPGR